MLEKTLESPLDCKEIQPVHPKGDQSWVFIGRTDVEAETPILWPPEAKNWLIGKDPDAGKDWRQEEKGTEEDEMVGWHHRLDRRESEWTLELVMDREARRAVIHGVAKSWTWLSDWTELNWRNVSGTSGSGVHTGLAACPEESFGLVGETEINEQLWYTMIYGVSLCT